MNLKNYKNLFALSSVCLAATVVETSALGPYEILPFEDGFIQEAYVDLLSGSSIADWTGWSGSSFVSPDAYNTHIGTDFSMQTGTPLYAAAAGTVIATYSGYSANDHSDPYYGNYVKIAVDGLTPNGESVNLIYGHMLSVSVSVGQHVNVGDQVGLSDNTGLSDSEHLHFESDLRSSGAAICPLYWAHFKYPIMFNPAGTHQLGRVVKVTAASTAIRNGRFDSSTQIGTAWQDQLYFCSYPKRGYYQVFIPNNTSYRSGWLRATDVEEVFTGTVIQALPDNVTYVHLGQLSSKYPIRATASDGAAQIGEIVFGGGRFVADQTSNGYYRIPVPGTSATWGWVKPNNRMVVYPQLTNPNVNLSNLPNNNFPITENFTATGKSMFGRPKFNRSVVKSFSPSAPGGDGKALFMTDKTNYGTGTSESVTVGKPGHRNYYVQCAVYFSYQPSYLGSGEWERYGIYVRDDGFAGLDTTYEGAGNSYALLWDNDDGRIRAARLVDGAITDLLPSVTYVTGSGWHTMRIEAYGTSIKYYLDGNLLVEASDSTFHSGQCGMGYSNHTGSSNPAARGAYFDNLVADTLDPVAPVITTQPASATKDPGQTAAFTVVATGATGYQWRKNGVNISGATSATLTLSNVQLSDAAFYRVVVSNAAGSVTSSAAQLVVTATATGVGTGGGLRGCYYDNQDFSALRVSRLDGPVNFDWATGSPEGSLGVDSFSARWTGQVQPRYSQTYTFYTTTDDGVRLWVNGVLLIDHWAGQSATEWSGSIALTAGQKYDLQMDYYENSGSASAQLRWSSASQLKELIPATQLYRPPPVVAAPGNQTVAENSPLNVPITLVSWDQVGTVTPIEGFESYGDGTPTDQIMFRKPGNSGTTSGFLDGSVTNYDVPTASFPSGNSSTRALHAYWSFLTGTTDPWLRLTTSDAATDPNPILDISQSLWLDIYSDKALQVAVDVRETNPSGAIGSNGGTSGTIEFVGVSGKTGTTPIPTRTVVAGAWTTLKFNLPQEPVAGFTGNGILESTTGKAVLEALALVPAGGMGVYNVYLDNFVQVQNAALSWSLEAGAPAGAAIDASTGEFTWTPVAGQGPATYNITVRVTDSGTPTTSATTTFAVTVSAPPVITAQPQSQAVGAGSNVTFSVTATGTAPLSYQWRKNGGTISGATASSYTLANAQPSDAGSYSVVVANAVGTVTSSNAVLTVSAVENPPSITAQPQSLTRIQGASATFSVTATGTAPLYYQWYWNGSALAGATQSSYTDASVQPADAGSYVVVVTNHVGSATSDAAILTVLVPPAIVTQPQSRAVIEGTNVTFTVSASGTAPLSFQWRKGGTPISGATGTSYSLSNVQASDAGTYTVVVTNAAGSATSANAVLTVNVPPAITVQPESQAVAAGSSVTFSVTASGSPVLSYQWRFNGTNLAGATASSYTLSNVQSAGVGLYSVVVSNPYGSVTSLEAALTLTGAIVFQDDFETCDLSGWTATAGTNGLDGSNAQNHTPGGGCSALVNHSLDKMYHNFGVEVAGRMRATWWIYDEGQTRVYAEVRAHTGAGYAEGVLQQLLAAGKYSGVTLSGEVWDGTKYQGRVSYGSSVGWFNLNGAGAPSRSTGWHKFVIERLADGTTLNFYVDGILSRTMTGVTDGALDSMLIGSVAGGSTVGDGWIDDVLVEYLDAPIIVTQPVGQTVTTGGSATFSVSAGNTVLSYQWRLNGENIAGATTSSWTVANAEAGDAGSYTVVVANGVGAVVSEQAVLVVENPPVITSQPVSQAVAAGATVTFSVGASGAALSYQWKLNGNPIAGATGSACTRSNVQAAEAGTYTVAVSNAFGSVTSDPAMLWVNTAPALGVIPNRMVHAGSPVVVTVSASDPEVPPQTLVFSLEAAPGGATIDEGSGVFGWTPALGDVGTTNTVTVRVTDNGTPAQSAVGGFVVSVVAPVTLTSAEVIAETITLTWNSISGQTYRVQYKNNVTDTVWTDLPDITAVAETASAVCGLVDGQGLVPRRFFRIMVVN
ncbi:MAG TPA: immunoglobulin domain-containing protein [Verrucomicrobiota bacterium]|nr:immunoglobulin domain-containing protein [Verrucomicrobiota bacterium]